MNLSKNEFMLVVDSTNGLAYFQDSALPGTTEFPMSIKDQTYLNVYDSIDIEKLDEKWSIDSKTLLKKLQDATDDEHEQLKKDIEKFWEKHNANPDSV